MEQYNRDLNFMLGEFFALGTLVENLNQVDSDTFVFDSTENLTTFLEDFARHFDVYCEYLERYKKPVEQKALLSVATELTTVYQAVESETFSSFTPNQNMFLSGFYFQMGLQAKQS